MLAWSCSPAGSSSAGLAIKHGARRVLTHTHTHTPTHLVIKRDAQRVLAARVAARVRHLRDHGCKGLDEVVVLVRVPLPDVV